MKKANIETRVIGYQKLFREKIHNWNVTPDEKTQENRNKIDKQKGKASMKKFKNNGRQEKRRLAEDQ